MATPARPVSPPDRPSTPGAEVFPVDGIKVWSKISPREIPETELSARPVQPLFSTTPFPVSPDINRKVALWAGDVTQLSDVDAVVHPTNEHFNERHALSERIMQRGGFPLQQALRRHLRTCKTGEAKLSKAFDLDGAGHLIHSCGPKYNAKYHTASESALYSCYAQILQLVRENEFRTVALPPVYTPNRGYPRPLGAHLALRVVRRFLERYSEGVQLIVFAVEDVDVGIFQQLMPLYFPRCDAEEDWACYSLPRDIGGTLGEPVIPERTIRITAKPNQARLEDTVDLSSGLESSVIIGKSSFARMQADVDLRFYGNRSPATLGPTGSSGPSGTQPDPLTAELQRQHRYDRLLRKSRQEDLSDFVRSRALYLSGEDRFGRTVVVMVGRRFDAVEMSNDRFLMHLVSLLDMVVQRDYVVVYFHTLTDRRNHPSLQFVQYAYNTLEYRYRKNLKAFYIVHPTFWSRVVTWWFTTFSAADMKNKVFCLGGVEYLKAMIPLELLQVPSFVSDYDVKVNGVHYNQPPPNTHPGNPEITGNDSL